MNTLPYRNQQYAILDTRALNNGMYACINISTSERPAHIWQPLVSGCAERPADYVDEKPVTAITIWRPILQVTPEMLWKPKERGGINLVECSHLQIVLTLGEAA